MKVYRGFRTSAGGQLVTVDGEVLAERLDLFNHSPDGFEWGYMGSGPAQLALAILADYLGDQDPAGEAVQFHQAFKSDMIAVLPVGIDWEITEDQVKKWLLGHRG